MMLDHEPDVEKDAGAYRINIQPPGLTDVEVAVFQKLLDASTERRLAPGVRLVEEELAKIFGITRERIRRVLLVLSQHRIVRLEPNRGAFIAGLNAREREEAFETRRLIERYVVGKICGMAKLNRTLVVNELRKNIADETQALARQDLPTQIRISGEFHLVLAAHAQNQQLLRTLQMVMAQMSLALASYVHDHDLQCSIGEHEVLLQALLDGDSSCADSLLLAHLDHLECEMAEKLPDGSDLRQVLLGP